VLGLWYVRYLHFILQVNPIAILQPFPISSRSSPEAIVSMLQKISCHHILATRASLTPLLTGITSLTANDFTLFIEEIPTLAHCYPHLGKETHSDPFVPYPTPKSPRDMDDVILYLHSSGSTGFPKPIPQTNRTVLHWYSLGIFLHFSLNTNTDILICLYRLYSRVS